MPSFDIAIILGSDAYDLKQSTADLSVLKQQKKMYVLLKTPYMKSNDKKVEEYDKSKLFPENWCFDN